MLRNVSQVCKPYPLYLDATDRRPRVISEHGSDQKRILSREKLEVARNGAVQQARKADHAALPLRSSATKSSTDRTRVSEVASSSVA